MGFVRFRGVGARLICRAVATFEKWLWNTESQSKAMENVAILD
jgi:hypothetical protein